MTKKANQAADEGRSVDTYIARCPKGVRAKLREIRAAMREVTPDATETTSYFDIPGYAYPGYDYNGMFAWFSYKDPFIGVHVRPPVLQDHEKELAAYSKTRAIVRFWWDQEVPLVLVKKLVKASLKVMKDKAKA